MRVHAPGGDTITTTRLRASAGRRAAAGSASSARRRSRDLLDRDAGRDRLGEQMPAVEQQHVRVAAARASRKRLTSGCWRLVMMVMRSSCAKDSTVVRFRVAWPRR